MRDLLIKRERGMMMELTDVDVVIDGAPSIDSVRLQLSNTYVSTNSFGGAKCRMHPSGAVFDVWRIEDHTNMRAALQPHTIEQLLQHNLLDIDAIIWDPQTDCLHEYGCQAAVTAGCIDLVNHEGISASFIEPQLAHVLIVKFKTGFSISPRLREFIAAAWEKSQPAEVLQIIQRKLPNARNEIETLLQDLPEGAARLWTNRVTTRSFS